MQQYTQPRPHRQRRLRAAATDTTYTYDALGRQTGMTDPQRRRLDQQLRPGRPGDQPNRPRRRHLPAAATDDTGDITSTTDARSRPSPTATTPSAAKPSLTSGSTTLASWPYDTLQPGKLTSSTRNTADGTYVAAAVGYDANGRSTGSR